MTPRAAATCLLLLAMSHPAVHAADGKQIYARRCAECHGAGGEGTREHYPHRLAGERSLGDLTKLIEETMPEDAPGTCRGEDAKAVAAYVYESFYSPLAQARVRPARVELSRLTVRQFYNAVADLVVAPRDLRADGEGLRAEFHRTGKQGGRRVLDRVDRAIDFDFGSKAAVEGLDDEQYRIRWSGSVFAADTGDYEFVARSENAVRLWVNDLERPLVDAAVKSGSEREHRGQIRLLGGRYYPLRLELTKFKQPTASARLCWRQPGRVEEVVPPRALRPQSAGSTFVLSTPFPPDDRSVGYERGASVSREWDRAVTAAAIEFAEYVARNASRLAGAGENDPQRAEKLAAYCRGLLQKAFRRPLVAADERLYVGRPFAEARSAEAAVIRCALLAVKSPRFLYREPEGRGDDYDVASRLAFTLYDSLPDEPLLQAAARGELSGEGGVRHAERIAAGLRARSKLREFFLQWLKVDQTTELAKDAAAFPGFDAAVASDLRTSLELSLDELLTSDACDFRQLFLVDTLYLNHRLASIYGGDLPAAAPFQRVKWPGGVRAGVLSHPYLMAQFAYTSTSSPIHRGVFLARSVLGRSLRPPPEAVAPLVADLHPGLTTRQRVALQTAPAACQGCHALINPLGFGLEEFDAIGRVRTQDQGKPIDASGSYRTDADETIRFRGAAELAAFLADSPQVHRAFVEQLFQYMAKQPLRAYGEEAKEDLYRAFARSNYNIRRLSIEIAALAAQPAGSAAQDRLRRPN